VLGNEEIKKCRIKNAGSRNIDVGDYYGSRLEDVLFSKELEYNPDTAESIP